GQGRPGACRGAPATRRAAIEVAVRGPEWERPMSKHSAWPPIGGLLLAAALVTVSACTPRSSAPGPPGAAGPRPGPPGPDLFEEVTEGTGIAFAYRNGEDTSPHLAILESLGGGAATIDFDGDGLVDLYFPGGGYFDGPDKRQIRGHPGKLYK